MTVTTWPFIENGKYSSQFRWAFSAPERRKTTSSYAAAINDTNLASLKDLGVEGAVVDHPQSAKVIVPEGTAWVGLNATLGPVFGDINIKEEPRLSMESIKTLQRYYGPDELVWFRSLNPRERYNFTISTDLNEPIALNSMVFYSGGAVDELTTTEDRNSGASPNGSSGEGRANVGAIAGGVVGGVVGVVLLGVLVWILIRRRRAARQARQDLEPKFEIEEPAVTPYMGRIGVVREAEDEIALPQHPKPLGKPEHARQSYQPVGSEQSAQPQQLKQPEQPEQPEREQLIPSRPRAVDGGSAPDAESDGMDPPEYDPAWKQAK